MIVVGIDPGLVTGIAIWFDPDYYENEEAGGDVDTAEVDRSTSVVSVLERMTGGRRVDIIGMERFIPNARMSSQPHAQQVIGAVKSWAEDKKVETVVMQNPGPARKIAPASLLKKLGWLTPTPDGHANSALQHILLVLATLRPERFARLVNI